MRQTFRNPLSRALCSALSAALLLFGVAALADGADPYPEFSAGYDVRVNGVKVGYARFSLQHLQADEYLYESEAGTSGLAKWITADVARESSRWRYVDNRIQVIEYAAEREKGDADDNARLVFDWEHLRVANRGAGEHWEIDIPEDTLDPLVMQLAMLLDLRDGARRFRYPVAVRGRIKHYEFAVAGGETITLPFGTYETLKLERLDESSDQSWIWSAPELEYFPVRFVKQKSNGIKTEILLHDLEFKGPQELGAAIP